MKKQLIFILVLFLFLNTSNVYAIQSTIIVKDIPERMAFSPDIADVEGFICIINGHYENIKDLIKKYGIDQVIIYREKNTYRIRLISSRSELAFDVAVKLTER